MWFFPIVASILVPLLLPNVVNYLSRKEYVIHSNGIIVISGASTGLGNHAALFLADKGYTVFAGVRKESDASDIVKKNIKGLYPVLLDVTKHESCLAAYNYVKKFSTENNIPIVGLVNNAGLFREIVAELHDLNDIRRVFDTNFFGVVDLTQTFLPALRESRGRIIMMSSGLGFLALPLVTAYASSKFALEGFSDGLRREVDAFGVSVSIIEPGYVKTPIFVKTEDNTLSPEKQQIAHEHYERYYNTKTDQKRARLQSKADEPIVTSLAIYDAISSQYPQTRYPVANADGTPIAVSAWITWLFPDRVLDYLFAHVLNE